MEIMEAEADRRVEQYARVAAAGRDSDGGTWDDLELDIEVAAAEARQFAEIQQAVAETDAQLAAHAGALADLHRQTHRALEAMRAYVIGRYQG